MHSPSCAINNSRTSDSVNVPSTSISRARRIRDAIALAMRWFRASSSRRLNQYFCACGACSSVLSRAHLERANTRATASLSVFAFSFGVGSRGGPLRKFGPATILRFMASSPPPGSKFTRCDDDYEIRSEPDHIGGTYSHDNRGNSGTHRKIPWGGPDEVIEHLR
jgi:hypothetical protein